MALPTFAIVLFAIILVALVTLLFYILFRGKPEITISETNDENDELVYDEVTGKHVSVEELVNEYQLDYLDDEKVEQVYSSLPKEIKSRISLKDVEAMLEFHYRIAASEEVLEEEIKLEMINDIFKRKGKPVDNEIIAAVLKLV